MEPPSPYSRDREHDALLVLSFGGPESPEEVMPFLRNVVRGRNVPDERLAGVAEHYYHFGGKSPINEQSRALIAALEELLREQGAGLPVYWGNLHWHPMLADALRRMRDDGVRRAAAFATSAYAGQSSCRKYYDAIEQARTEVGEGAPEVHKLRPFYDHPGFIEPMIDRVSEALAEVPADRRADAHLVFTGHSIPTAMPGAERYAAQLEEACRLVAGRASHDRWALVWQSRSGPPHQRWLEPDIVEHLCTLAQSGARDAVVAPIGFISDHMEVRWDLDTEARAIAEELGLSFVRARTVGTDPRFVAMIPELVRERQGEAEPRGLSRQGPPPMDCPPGCCS